MPAIEMTADEVKERLRGRHPAALRQNGYVLPGPWTTIEEYAGIDLLAISANKRPPTGAQRGGEYSWVGYEVKVTRGDLRRELLDPSKRHLARRICHEFYVAVPKGLLKEEEIAFEDPGFAGADFVREPCPENCRRYSKRYSMGNVVGANGKSGREARVDAAYGDRACTLPTQFRESEERAPRGYEGNLWRWSACEACQGMGYERKSRVEREAPILWIPPDIGLVEVTRSHCRVVRKSPVWPPDPLSPEQLGALARWVSLRPDQRHHGVIRDLAKRRGAVDP